MGMGLMLKNNSLENSKVYGNSYRTFWRNHCIIVGECLHLGFLIHSEECYDLLTARIRMQFVRHHAVVVRISRSPDFLEVA